MIDDYPAKRRRWWTAGVIIACSLAMLVLGLRSEQGINLYVRQAESLIHLRLDIPDFYHDLAVYHDTFYLPIPMFPAVLLVPGVILLGASNALPILLAAVLSVASIVVFVSILRHIEVSPDGVFWVTVALFFGTGYWYSVMASWGVWFFAHVVATLCLLLAVREALVTRRAALSGFFMGLAYLSRPLLVFPAFFLIAALWETHTQQGRRAQLAALSRFALLAGGCVAIAFWLNWIRFDDPFQSGYVLVPHRDILKLRLETHGLFSLAYVPFNLAYMFFQGPHVDFSSPGQLRDVSLDQFGTSLTYASPFLIAAFFAQWKRSLVVGAWLSVVTTLAVLAVYFNNGFVQVNFQRYTLDMIPILMLLVGVGWRRFPPGVFRGLVLYSVGLNIITVLGVPAAQMLEHLIFQ